MKMTRIVGLSLLSMLSVACAKTNFATRWTLAPAFAPEDPTFTEFQARESVRRHEVAALGSERREIGDKLARLYDIHVLRERAWTDGDLNLIVGGWYKEQRNDVTLALERFVVVSERLALLTNRPTATDFRAERARFLLAYVKAWRPKAIPYYK